MSNQSPPQSPTSETEFTVNVQDQEMAPVNIKTQKFPFCLVWTPIPVITW